MKKIFSFIGLFLTLSASNLAYGTEILSCYVSIATPEASQLEFVDNTYGVRLLSEKYEPGDKRERNLKSFEFNLEKDGTREITFTLDKNQPSGGALLNLRFEVADFQGNNEDLQIMEMKVDARSVVTLENKEFRQSHTSSMMCIKDHGVYR